MKKSWTTPEVINFDLRDTASTNQPDMPRDGAYGDLFQDDGYGHVCDRCS